MATEATPDFAAMTMEEMDEWIAAEDAKTPFTSFDLSTNEGRQALLRKYYMIGDTSLFRSREPRLGVAQRTQDGLLYADRHSCRDWW